MKTGPGGDSEIAVQNGGDVFRVHAVHIAEQDGYTLIHACSKDTPEPL